MLRTEVYKLIDGERDYQDSKPPRPKKDSEWSVADWIIFIYHSLKQAFEAVYFLSENEEQRVKYGYKGPSALDCIRIIAALCVACMEHNETPPRK